MSKNLYPQEFSLSAILIASFFIEVTDYQEINAWGNWFQLIGQYLETYSSFNNKTTDKIQ